jgi:glutamate 5-kinase
MKKAVLVYKIGTAGITNTKGNIDNNILNEVVRQLATLHKNYHILIVSSGAVGTGKKYLPNYTAKIEERKAAAAIGNPILIQKYATTFKKYNIAIAQSLCERGHFSDRQKFLQLRSTYEELWRNNIIPIANENDVVSNYELKFSDNDELATLLAIGLNASHLLIATSVEGVLDQENKVVKSISKFDTQTLSLARKDKSSVGLGGMLSKLTFAKLASSLGIKVHIFAAKKQNSILDTLQEKTGTIIIAKNVVASARQKWLASGSKIIGTVQIDNGAKNALLKRKSLLAVGVSAIIQNFDSHEAIEIVDENQNIIAIAKAKISAKNLAQNLKTQNIILAHADEIVIL